MKTLVELARRTPAWLFSVAFVSVLVLSWAAYEDGSGSWFTFVVLALLVVFFLYSSIVQLDWTTLLFILFATSFAGGYGVTEDSPLAAFGAVVLAGVASFLYFDAPWTGSGPGDPNTPGLPDLDGDTD